SWSTATEINNSGFQIQRLKASKIEVNENWQNIGFVNGIGTSTEAHTYSFQDHEITSGKYQYRLKQIDFDGSFEYSNIIAVEIGTPVEFILAQNFPNPFNPGTNISWQTPVSGQQILKVYDVLGNEVAILIDEFKSAGSYQVEFNAAKLSSGVYFYKLQVGSLTQTKKMQLIK
ncbi:MAG: T9SS type A sorting domain-containing protein, partial [Ignavibacterium sp.]|nr:T9SS type A sorting domain-containing protein [Ignavibacterium sp.]